MRLPTFRNIGIVYRKEMLDLLRDKRTLFGMILLPLVLYPLLMIGLTQILAQQIGQIERQEFVIAVAGWQDLPELADALAHRDGGSRWSLQHAAQSELETLRRRLAAGELHAILEVSPNAGGDVEAGGRAALRVMYNGADEDSLAAWRRLQPALDRLSRNLVERRLRAAALDPALLEPLRVEAEDQATASQRGAFHLGRLLCVMLVVMAATGAFYPAVDLASGEKERGTMQTLLVSPASRGEIVLGKYFAVLTVCLVTALLNLASMGMTFSRLFPGGGVVPAGALDFAPGPGALLALVAVLIPLAGLFCALCLGLSAYASSYKEAMLFLSPFLLVAVLGAMTPVIPGLQPTLGLQLLPVANAALVLYRVIQGAATGGEVALNIAVNTAYALLALRWAAWIFEREDVLLRGTVEIDWRFWRRAAGPLRPHPSAAEGVAYLLVAVAATTALGLRLAGWPLPSILVATQTGAFLLPLLLMLRLGRIDPRAALGLRHPGGTNLAVAVVTAAGLFVLSLSLMSLFVSLFPESLAEMKRQVQPIEEALGGAGPAEWAGLAALLVLLAPLCEELAFRGFLLGSLRPAVGTPLAVLLAGSLFGLLHPPMPRPLVLGGVGVCFALMAVRTGSLWTAVAAHAVNNGLTVLLEAAGRSNRADGTGPEDLGILAGEGPGLRIALGALALAVTVLGLLLLRPAREGGRSGRADTPAPPLPPPPN
jgi:sodium transport system permease protein